MSPATGAIVGSSLVSLYDGVARPDREDIFDSLLSADRFASRHHDQRRDYTNWFFRYRRRLESRGWVLKSPILHTPQVVFGPAELDSVTFDLVASAGAQALADLVQASWRSMRVHRFADHFFDKGQRNGELGRLQMVPCMNDADSTLLMLICGIRLTGSIDMRDFEFWSETRREMVLRISGGVYRFDRATYGRYRQEIRNSLSGDADRAIEEFKL